MDDSEQRIAALVSRLREISQFPSQLLRADVGRPPGHYPSIRFEFRPINLSGEESQRVGKLVKDFVALTEEPADMAHPPQLISFPLRSGPTGITAADLTLKTKDLDGLEALVNKLARHEKPFRRLMLNIFLKEHAGGLILNNAASYIQAHAEASERWAADQSLDYRQLTQDVLLSKPDGKRIADLLETLKGMPATAGSFIQESLRQEAVAQGTNKAAIRRRLGDFAYYVPLFRSYIEEQRGITASDPVSSGVSVDAAERLRKATDRDVNPG